MNYFDIRAIKRQIDEKSIIRMSDLIDMVVEADDLKMYYCLVDNDIFELIDAYIERRKSIHNRNLIKKYYMELGANLIE